MLRYLILLASLAASELQAEAESGFGLILFLEASTQFSLHLLC